MDENKDLSALMQRLEESNDRQVRYARLQCLFSAAAALCCLVVLALVIGALPKLGAMAAEAESVMRDVSEMSSALAEADWESLVEDLETVSAQLSQADLGGIATDVSGLVTDAAAKLNAIDFENLNKAISDLSDVVEPLANFFNKFG